MYAQYVRSADHARRLRQDAGRWLRSLRESREMTQRDLAERVGLRYYTFISQIEGGHGRIPPDQYEAWAKALEIAPRDFAKAMLRYYDPFTFRLLFPEDEAVSA
ncbi:MAG: helix-turn-helix domain-containing protein [Alphaproteobacteria bacterium]